MTADAPARVTREDLAHVAEQMEHDLRDSRALTQAQAERIAALEAEVARLKTDNDYLGEQIQAIAAEAVEQREAAESSLAETRAKVEGLEKVAEAAELVCAAYPIASGRHRMLDGREGYDPIRSLNVALSALPEAKPAAQAEGE